MNKKAVWDKKKWDALWRSLALTLWQWGSAVSHYLLQVNNPSLWGAGHNYLVVSREEKRVLGLDYPDNCLNPPLSLLGIYPQP